MIGDFRVDRFFSWVNQDFAVPLVGAHVGIISLAAWAYALSRGEGGCACRGLDMYIPIRLHFMRFTIVCILSRLRNVLGMKNKVGNLGKGRTKG